MKKQVQVIRTAIFEIEIDDDRLGSILEKFEPESLSDVLGYIAEQLISSNGKRYIDQIGAALNVHDIHSPVVDPVVKYKKLTDFTDYNAGLRF